MRKRELCAKYGCKIENRKGIDMAYLLGIDIGTSGTKVIAIDERGNLAASATREYPLLHSAPIVGRAKR